MPARLTLPLIAALLLAGPGCQSAYYGTMEAFGVHKREILAQRVGEARDAQQAAKEQFTDALDRFIQVVNVETGQLGQTYRTLRDEYETSLSRAKAVSSRIEAVEGVGEALFEEWHEELAQYHDPQLRAASESRLAATRQRYETLVRSMHATEQRMQPVLQAMHDQVLFLKHNLNAQAVASLQQEADALKRQVDALVAQMQQSIDQATRFIDQMEQP